MNLKTNFSFELQYPADAAIPYAQRDEVIRSVGPALQALFAGQDSTAVVTANDSQKGSHHKILEMVTTLDDAQIAAILKDFSEKHGLSIQALE
ncbi:hypothetical protein [Polaromonas sp.]|uniref:hypothetical protein n=1 Tax=Polaromonas sp. TaxID=1869339 RepID=UPI003263A969